MVGIEFFAGCSQITQAFIKKGGLCYSLDFVQLKNERKIDFLTDFLAFDYKQFSPGYIGFLYFGLPCETYSKASGGLHWCKNEILTMNALAAYLYFLRMVEIIKYFDKAVFYIENPSGAVCSKAFFLEFVSQYQAYIYTLSLSSFGFCTQKKTNVITNSELLLVSPTTYRVNGRYQKQKFDNLSLKNRQRYPFHFAEFIVNNFFDSQILKIQK